MIKVERKIVETEKVRRAKLASCKLASLGTKSCANRSGLIFILLNLSNNLSFGLSSSDAEVFAPQIGEFSGEMRGQAPRMSRKRTQDASKHPEDEGVKPKAQVNITFFLL